MFANIFVILILSLLFSMILSMFSTSRPAAPQRVARQRLVRRHGGWRGRRAVPDLVARQTRQQGPTAARQALLRRHPPWRGTAAAPPAVVRHCCSATLHGTASLGLENMLKIMLKNMLKLKITNISANMLKIK
jgi:hypothetical protein